MSIESNFIHDIDIYRKSESTGFDPAVVWTLWRSTKGLMDQVSGDEARGEDGKTIISDHKLYMGVVEILLTDRVLYADDVYEIVRIHNPNYRNDHLEIYLKRYPAGMTDEMGIES